MKKTLTILLATILLILPVVALAASWNITQSETASPFKTEVIKLAANADVTGMKYYTRDDAISANKQDYIYYAVKLVLPSYADANAYYGTSDLYSGSKIKVTITYKGISNNKDKDVVYIALTSQSQTLWYNGETFEAGWAANANVFTQNNHILRGTALNAEDVSITACVGGKGNINDITLDGCYKIARKSYYGVKPCVNCTATNLSGYSVLCSNSPYGVFFAVNNADKITGVYVIDKNSQTTSYLGAKVLIDKHLYRWEIVGVSEYCDATGCYHAKYGMRELPYAALYTKSGNLYNGYIATSDGHFTDYCNAYKVNSDLRDMTHVYYEDDDGLFHPVTGLESWWQTEPYYYKQSANSNGFVQYADSTALRYYDVYYSVEAYTGEALHKMTSAYTVNDDGCDKSYLNAANYVLKLFDLTYDQIAAGQSFMSDTLILSNFGFKADVCATATWNKGAEIVTIPVTEIPATGDNDGSILGVTALIVGAMLLSVAICNKADKQI